MTEMYDGKEGKLGVGRVLLTIVAVILAIAVVVLGFFIFMVKTEANIGSFYMMTTDEATTDVLPSGSLVLMERVDPTIEPSVSAGQDVVFVNGEGSIFARTTGSSSADDTVTYIGVSGGQEYEFEHSRIRAVAKVYLPYLGMIIDFICTPFGLIVCVAIPLFIYLVYEIIKLIRITRRGNEEEEPAYMDIEALPQSTPPPVVIGKDNLLNGIGSIIEQEDEELVPAKPIEKPKPELEFPKASPFLQETQEFQIPKVQAVAPQAAAPRAGAARAATTQAVASRSVASQAVAPQTVSPPAATTQAAAPQAAGEFKASVRPPSGNTPNEFQIEGISVKVDDEGIKLNMDKAAESRDIAITITSDCASVKVGNERNEVNFALFKEKDNDRKVVIRRKSKEQN